jgi:hypothetical protein
VPLPEINLPWENIKIYAKKYIFISLIIIVGIFSCDLLFLSDFVVHLPQVQIYN